MVEKDFLNCKKGDRVIVIKSPTMNFLPPKGEIGTIIEKYSTSAFVFISWDNKKYNKESWGWFLNLFDGDNLKIIALVKHLQLEFNF